MEFDIVHIGDNQNVTSEPVDLYGLTEADLETVQGGHRERNVDIFTSLQTVILSGGGRHGHPGPGGPLAVIPQLLRGLFG